MTGTIEPLFDTPERRKAEADRIAAFIAPFRKPQDSEERIVWAYNTFRGGFREDAPCPIPHWDDAPPWVRDAMRVAYMQGKLDRND